jgi:predicted HTH transcriptional regulator
VPELEEKMSPEERDNMRFWHALPVEWWSLSYDEFLKARRSRIAKVVRAAWDLLCDGEPPSAANQPSVAELIAGGETGGIEFKSTLRTNLHTGQHDEKIQLSALKTIAGFLNAGGGTLLIGVSDDGNVVGIAADGFSNEDKMSLHLIDLIRSRLGPLFLPYIHPEFEDEEGGRVLLVRCEKGPKPAFVKDGQMQRFFVRAGNSTAELQGVTVTEYVKSRFD